MLFRSEEAKVVLIAKAVKNLFWKYGNRKNKHAARLRFLWQSLGREEFLRRFNEELAALEKEVLPLTLEVPPEVVVPHDDADPRVPHDLEAFGIWKKRYVRAQKQPGLFSVLLPVELGFIPCDQTRQLAQFLAPIGDDVVRMTRDQNFLLRNIAVEQLASLYNFLKEHLPSVKRPRILGRVLSCAGASTCQLGICLSRQAAKVLIRDLAASGLDLDRVGDLRLNISGCPNACGHHPSADLGFSGKALRRDGVVYPGYAVHAGAVIEDGRTSLAEVIGDIPARALPAFVKDLVAVFISKTARYSTFAEYIAGEGREDLRTFIARYKDVPAFEDDKNYYFDWGADKLFSLAERRAGECSAGLFDLIEVDLNNIRQLEGKLAVADSALKPRLLAELVFHASRALLITRGVEPKNEDELYEAFRQHFIEAGHIDPSFTEILLMARRQELSHLALQGPKVLALAQAVVSLYERMDNGFNFRKPESVTDEKPTPVAPAVNRAAAFKDLRGVLCPLNFVKTKVELAKLKAGDILEIWLDDGAPIENVPGSVQGEGHTIISREKAGDHWKVVIRKT